MERIELAKRMMASAADYERSARLLAGKVDPRYGEASAHLSILALEIALKCASFLATGHVPRSHEYRRIWQILPRQTRDDVLRRSKLRAQPEKS
ncbi:hypothetical protein SH611_22790 [Geminicoccaceae bacterium 1502E]|nr:hypothetical protein [Geminicoccaceae bacterium 1502E]